MDLKSATQNDLILAFRFSKLASIKDKKYHRSETTHRSVLSLLLNGLENGTDKMAPIESSINQAIQLPLTI